MNILKESTDVIQKICDIGRLMFEKGLTDSGGGNISVRHNGFVYITRMMTGEKKRWEMSVDDVIVADSNFSVIIGDPQKMSRESRLHFGIYENFPDIGAIIHGHAMHLLAFASAQKTMMPLTEQYEYFIGQDPLECIPITPGATQELAREVVTYFKALRNAGNSAAKGNYSVLLPKHGVVVAAHDLDEAFVILDTLEVNARVTLLSKLL
ncbi:MAG: class II aldolase/adducin family protein [Ruminiclostridium sp.]|nr:class II aldolase/adducin family protein [Ruminiclostridium sp.]